ncbi:hypothetical protein BDQ17DRAFT_1215276, partial [Cyathus striatus]
NLQLLRDADTQWSSTLLMIEQAIMLHQFVSLPDFNAAHKQHILTDSKWKALGIFQDILLVPHAFQQKLSAEKTPTLCNVIPTFKNMEVTEHAHDGPDTSQIVQAGLDKLSSYFECIELVPAYVLSLS